MGFELADMSYTLGKLIVVGTIGYAIHTSLKKKKEEKEVDGT